MDNYRILGDTFFVRVPTTRHELFLWICGTLRVFFQKTTKFNFLSEMSKNYTHIETVQLISIIPEITQVIFQSQGRWKLFNIEGAKSKKGTLGQFGGPTMVGADAPGENFNFKPSRMAKNCFPITEQANFIIILEGIHLKQLLTLCQSK